MNRKGAKAIWSEVDPNTRPLHAGRRPKMGKFSEAEETVVKWSTTQLMCGMTARSGVMARCAQVVSGSTPRPPGRPSST